MSGDLGAGSPSDDLDRPRSEGAPSWLWAIFGIGLTLGAFGILLVLMGALMSETGVPRGGEYIHVTQYHVSSWLFWLGAACVVVGTALSWPGYRIGFGGNASAPLPTWFAPVLVLIAAVTSSLALPVALAAAPHSRLHQHAYEVTGIVWLMILVGGFAVAVQAARDRLPRNDEVEEADDAAADEADDASADEAAAPAAGAALDPRRMSEANRELLRRRWPPG